MRDLYQVMGVKPSASQADIRRAFHKLAHCLHPDRIQPKEYHKADKFKTITAAASILTDPVKRRQYDLGKIDQNGEKISQTKLTPASRVRFKQPNAKKPTHQHSLTIGFFDAIKGKKLNVKVGGIRHKLSIPPGINHGHMFALNAVDRLKKVRHREVLKIKVKNHSHFTRHGDDIHLVVPVTPYEAVLGAKIEIPTIWGARRVWIPENAKNGQVVRLKGLGVKGQKRAQGDQLIVLNITMPKDDSNGMKKMMKKWRHLAPYNPRLPWMRTFSS